MSELAFSGILALAALAGFALAVGLVRRYPPAGIGLASLVILTVWEVPMSTALVTFAGLAVTATDIVTLTLFVVGVLELKQLRTNLQGWFMPWLLLGTLIALSLLRGAMTYGLGQATNEARLELWFYFAMTWALATRPDRLKLHTVSLVLGWMLVLVAFYHGLKQGLGSPTTRPVVIRPDGSWGPNRILVAGQAALLLLCAGTVFLKSADLAIGRPRFTWSSLVFLGVVLLSQHRSVWIGGAVGMAAVLISAKAGGTRGGARSRAFALLAVVGGLVVAVWVFGRAGSEAVDSVTSSATFGWRAAGWQTLVSDAIARGPAAIAIGEPYGNGFVRTIGQDTTGVQPHNWYVQIFLRLGIIGLMVLAGMLVAAVTKSRAGSPEWMFSVVAAGVYAFGYSIDWYLAPWLAVAIVVSLRGGRVPDDASSQARPRAPALPG
jgi:hypothetical protein